MVGAVKMETSAVADIAHISTTFDMPKRIQLEFIGKANVTQDYINVFIHDGSVGIITVEFKPNVINIYNAGNLIYTMDNDNEPHLFKIILFNDLEKLYVFVDGELVKEVDNATTTAEGTSCTLYAGDTSGTKSIGTMILYDIILLKLGEGYGSGVGDSVIINENFKDSLGVFTPTTDGNGTVTLVTESLPVSAPLQPCSYGSYRKQIFEIPNITNPDAQNDQANLHWLLNSILYGKMVGADTSDDESEAQSIYNGLTKATASWIRNIPVYEVAGVLHLSIGWSCIRTAYLMDLLCRYFDVCLTDDLPKASEILNNWPVEATDYYGSGAPRWNGNVNPDGSGVSGVNANNQNMELVNVVFRKALIDGSINDTVNVSGFSGTVAEFVKNFIDKWKAKFPDYSTFKGDAYSRAESWPYTFQTFVAVADTIRLLYTIGLISDSDLESYLTWVESILNSTLENVTVSHISLQSPIILGVKSLIANLRKQTDLGEGEGLFGGKCVAHKFPLFDLLTHGVIVKRTPTVKKGDTFIIDNWLGRSIGLDGIELSNSTVAKVTKQNWKVVVSP